MPLYPPPGQVLVDSLDNSTDYLANKIVFYGNFTTSLSNNSIVVSNGFYISAGTTFANTGTVVFSNSNGISFDMQGNAIGATAGNVPYAIAAGGSTLINKDLVLVNSNNVSFGINGQTITASASSGGIGNFNGIAIQGVGTVTSGTAIFVNSNNISFGMNGSTMTASFFINGLSGASAGTTKATSGTIIFSNSNNITFGMDTNGVITGAAFAVPSAGIGEISAGTAQIISGTAIFSNSNNVSFGINGSTMTASASIQTLGLTAISAGTTKATSGTVVLSNSNNISFGINGNTLTAGFNILSMYEHPKGQFATNALGAFSNATQRFAPFFLVNNLTATQAKMLFSITVQTSSANTMQGTITINMGLYTNNANTLSLASSGSQTYVWSATSNGSTSVYNGLKELTVPLNVNATPGHYWLGYWIRTSSARGTVGLTHAGGIVQTLISGPWGAATNSTNFLLRGCGVMTATTSTMVSNVAISDLNQLHVYTPWILLRAT